MNNEIMHYIIGINIGKYLKVQLPMIFPHPKEYYNGYNFLYLEIYYNTIHYRTYLWKFKRFSL